VRVAVLQRHRVGERAEAVDVLRQPGLVLEWPTAVPLRAPRQLRRPIAEATSKDATVDVADQALALLDVA